MLKKIWDLRIPVVRLGYIRFIVDKNKYLVMCNTSFFTNQKYFFFANFVLVLYKWQNVFSFIYSQ